MNFYPYISAAKLDTLAFESQDDSMALVTVETSEIDPVETTTVYRAGINPYGEKIVLHNMAQIFNSALEKAGKCAGAFTIKITQQYGQRTIPLTVTHCKSNTAGMLDDEFLTCVKSQCVDPDAKFFLARTRKLQGEMLVLTALYVDDNKNITEIRKSSDAFTDSVIQFALEDIKQIMGSELVPAALIAEEGERRKVWYIVNFCPDLILLFRNTFNSPEYLPLRVQITTASKTESKTAVSAGEHIAYDVYTHDELEVKSYNLTKQEIVALAQAVASNSCYAVIPGVEEGEIVFSQSDIKHSSSGEDLDEISFSFRFCKRFGGLPHQDIQSFPYIFTDNFTKSFS